ncbi:MAG: hypothetical protein HY763_00715 [Planctomycetes bacterium]|nr:hypothetical protein [Planctomycetota bacterium]
METMRKLRFGMVALLVGAGLLWAAPLARAAAPVGNEVAAASADGPDVEQILLETIEAQKLVPLPENVRVSRRLADGVAPSGVTASSLVDKLIYSSTQGLLLYPPGRNIRVADDVTTDAVNSCGMTRYVIRVSGGVPNGSGEFTTKVGLWTGCPPPQGTGTLIPGTEFTFSGLSDDAAEVFDLEIDVSSAPVAIPPTVWVRVQFDTNSAGWVVGSLAEKGFSADIYHHPSTGCSTWFGGCPICAVFYVQIYADATCETHHLAYAAISFTRPGFALGSGIYGADDILLVEPTCELSALEVGMRGTSGAYQVDIDIRPPEDPNPTPGTLRTFTSHPQAGNGQFQLARFVYPPGIGVPNPAWLAWKANRNNTGPILATRTQAGFSDPRLWCNNCPILGPGWQDFIPTGSRPPLGVIYVAVYCRGEAPRGACCKDQLPNQPIRCDSDVPVTSCLGERWLNAVSCGTGVNDPFTPECGTHACCTPDNNCQDLFYNQDDRNGNPGCKFITDPLTPVVSCASDADCPPNRFCQPDGKCSPRTAIWTPGEFCGFEGYGCPIFACFYGVDDCFAADTEIICDTDDDCPGERVCLISHCDANTSVECTQDFDCPPGDFCRIIGNHICDGRRGCGNLTCCDQVCRDQPPESLYCCEVSWDSGCVQLANNLCEVAPGNDVCGDPSPNRGAAQIVLDPAAFEGNAVANNTFATTGTQPGDRDPGACCNNRGVDALAAGSLWYYFVMPSTPQNYTTARIHTCATPGSDTAIDSILQVFSVGDPTSEVTSCNSLRVIGCNDDYPNCGDGQLSDLCVENLVPGQKYYILLGAGLGAFQGPYRLDVAIPCPRQLPPNNICGQATPVPTGNPNLALPFNLRNASLDCPAEPCVNDMKSDIWYEYVAPCTGAAVVETCSPVPADPDPPTALAVYRIPNPQFPCDLDSGDVVGCNDDAPVGAAAHARRPQSCETYGHCSGSPSTLCLLGETTCPVGQNCVPTDCDTDANCQTVCETARTLCDTVADCNHCEITNTPCVAGPDCFQCGPGGALCDPFNPNCPPGVLCQNTQACIITGDTCVPEKCVSSCGEAAAVLAPVFAGQTYKIRLGGDPGEEPQGTLTIKCEQDDCQPNLIPDLQDIADGRSMDCNGNLEPDECEIAACAPNNTRCRDCNSNGVIDVCEIDQESTAFGGPFYCVTDCDPDCNTNGRPDTCDIATCIANPDCKDCNNNQIPDKCDIASGHSPDVNQNRVPDECECTTPSQCDDGNICTDDDCVGGACVHNPNAATCADDGNTCTEDVCNNGTCTHPNKPVNSPCALDALECTADVCNAGGLCTHPNKPVNTPCTADSNECTNDVCNASGVCTHPNAQDGTPCTGGQCQNGQCIVSNVCNLFVTDHHLQRPVRGEYAYGRELRLVGDPRPRAARSEHHRGQRRRCRGDGATVAAHSHQELDVRDAHRQRAADVHGLPARRREQEPGEQRSGYNGAGQRPEQRGAAAYFRHGRQPQRCGQRPGHYLARQPAQRCERV